MKIKSTVLILLLALSIMMPIFAQSVTAYPVTQTPSTDPKIIEWYPVTGYTDYLTLLWNPEYLKLKTATPIETETTIIVQGKDVFGQNLEAKVVIPGTHTVPILPEKIYYFMDTHTAPPKPVAFAEITKVFQQNGQDNAKFLIATWPEPFQEYLGQYHKSTGYEPGYYTKLSLPFPANTPGNYLVGNGPKQAYSLAKVPVEPSNPDPLKIVVNWVDDADESVPEPEDHDLFPQTDEIGGALGNSLVSEGTAIYVEGLDQKGNKVVEPVEITTGQKEVEVDCTYTWSTVCKVWGGNQIDSYYIFTHPKDQRSLFYYYLLIDHITIHPGCYDILANPDVPEGTTTITVALRDIDGNLIHAADYGKIDGIEQEIIVNFFASGGKIEPSCDVHIPECNVKATTTLKADTNPRTINVTADVNVPVCTYHPRLNLFAWTELTFDGINSANSYKWGDWPIHTMMWGYHTQVNPPTGNWRTPVTLPVPAKPWLPLDLGGPNPDGIKLDGPIYEVMIPLFVGCNLISSPVHPLLCGNYYDSYPESIPDAPSYPIIDNKGIPMDLLFGKTSATDCIEAIWWYTADGPQIPPSVYGNGWRVYVPGVTVDPNDYFRDGIGYWIKAEKPCTLEISGVFMENGPFTPPTYDLPGNTWSLVGVTSVTGISLDDYLESTSGSVLIEAAGPVWMYINPGLNPDGTSAYPSWFATEWIRNPPMLYPGQAFWVYNKVPNDLYIAP